MSIDHRPHRDPIPKTVSDPLTQEEIDERDKSRRIRRRITAYGLGIVLLAGAGGGTAYALTRGSEASPAPAAGGEATPSADAPSSSINPETSSVVITTPEAPASSIAPSTPEAPVTTSVAEVPGETSTLSPERFEAITGMTYDAYMESTTVDERLEWATTTLDEQIQDRLSLINNTRSSAGLAPITDLPETISADNTAEEIYSLTSARIAVIFNQFDPTTYMFDVEASKKLLSAYADEGVATYDSFANGDVAGNQFFEHGVTMSDGIAYHGMEVVASSTNITDPNLGELGRQIITTNHPNSVEPAPYISTAVTLRGLPGGGYTWLVKDLDTRDSVPTLN